MKARDIMTENPVCCVPDTNLQDVARMMVDNDCGEIPIIEGWGSKKPIGVVTDRDIVCRTVAEGKNPLQLTASDVMSNPVVTVTPDTSLKECCHILEENQIRRVPVVDENGGCCGIVSQADIAQKAPKQVAEVVKEISQPIHESCRVGSS